MKKSLYMFVSMATAVNGVVDVVDALQSSSSIPIVAFVSIVVGSLSFVVNALANHAAPSKTDGQ